MHKKFPFAFVAALLLLAMACKKDPPLPDVSCDKPTNDKEISKQLIIGTWRLKRFIFESTTGTIRRTVDTDQIDVKFATNGIVEYYEKENLIDTCTYDIDIMKKYSLYAGDTTRNVLWIPNFKLPKLMTKAVYHMVPLRVCNDSLYLLYNSFAYDEVGDYYFYRLK